MGPGLLSGLSGRRVPAARPVPLGGNAYLAFYKLRTSPDAYYTMVMRRVTDRAGLARYVLVNALPAQ